MRSITMPNGEKLSQDEVLRRIAMRQNDGCVAHLRVLLVHDEGVWVPVGGRIDIARPGDQPAIVARPVGGARLLPETVALDELSRRLAAAFAGEPFLVAREQLAGHGMDSAWLGERTTDSWAEYGVTWPLVTLVPTKPTGGRPYPNDAYEAEGKVEALDGILDCTRLTLGYVGAQRVLDGRGQGMPRASLKT